MFSRKIRPSVTPEDRQWIEEALLWFEKEYGASFLKSVPILEPTSNFFDRKFDGTAADAHYLLDKASEVLSVKSRKIDLAFFGYSTQELLKSGVTIHHEAALEQDFALGFCEEPTVGHYQIDLEIDQLSNTPLLLTTLVYELSHLKMVEEERIDEPNEYLADLHGVVFGFGIFMANSIWNFRQWRDNTHQGWHGQKTGFLPEEMMAYAIALFQNYQQGSDAWSKHLNRSMFRLFKKNMEYLEETEDEILFPEANPLKRV
ncbi:MAG: hypothetical protein ACFB10_13230 [Salibacteraceae bacterium]